MNHVEMDGRYLPATAANGELAPTRQTLLERLRNLDDDSSWHEFFNTYWKLIYCAAMKAGLSETEAEDVVQETMIGVARNMGEFRYEPEKCSFKGWLMHLTRRRIIDRLRRRQTQPQHFVALASNNDTSTTAHDSQFADTSVQESFEGMWEEEWQKNLLGTAMEKVKRAVKPDHFQIFYMFSIKNMAARDISELTGASTAKVHVVQHRIGRLIKREVQKLQKS
jgi:RNA polymerase sigma-70 factor (ECF subfamily)